MMKKLELTSYAAQAARWPSAGRHILAQFDAETIVVYQAYRPSIARHAALHQRLGGPEFSFGRMSWIKPNFLWMMFRSGLGHEARPGGGAGHPHPAPRGSTAILAAAVPSSFVPEAAPEPGGMRRSDLQGSDVRLQWDPDHHLSGAPVARRAIQLGLRGAMLRRFAEEWTVGVEDISELVAAQREVLRGRGAGQIEIPLEEVYWPTAAEAARRVGIERWEA